MTTTVQGIATQYQVIGRGQPLVMLHGWGCDWQIWYPLIQPLSTHFQLIIPDLPAFGQSATPPQVWNSSEYLTWLTAFIKQSTNGAPYLIMGHSFGGKLAALLAAQESRQPSGLEKVILVAASGLPDPLPPVRQLQKAVLRWLPTRLKESLPSQVKLRLLQATGSATDHFHSSPQQRQILQSIVREDISNAVVNITTPTLLLWGKLDLDTPPHQGERYHHLIPGSHLVVFPTAGHFPFIDVTTDFLTELTQFATGTTAGAV